MSREMQERNERHDLIDEANNSRSEADYYKKKAKKRKKKIALLTTYIEALTQAIEIEGYDINYQIDDNDEFKCELVKKELKL